MEKIINVGDRVKVMVPNTDKFGSRDISQINGNTYTVSNIVRTRRATGGNEATYELEGAKSSFGIPYTFVKDWLIPVGGDYE